MFIREGTPNGFSTMSTGRPSAMYGMSSTGRMRDTTPLLPWRPAILSPACRRRLMAIKTFTIFCTPGCNSSPWVSFFFLISYNSSASSRFCCRLNLISSNCLAKSSSDKRISNQSCLLGRPARYSVVISLPLASFIGPPLAFWPTIIRSIRSNASLSKIRNWSPKS